MIDADADGIVQLKPFNEHAVGFDYVRDEHDLMDRMDAHSGHMTERDAAFMTLLVQSDDILESLASGNGRFENISQMFEVVAAEVWTKLVSTGSMNLVSFGKPQPMMLEPTCRSVVEKAVGFLHDGERAALRSDTSMMDRLVRDMSAYLVLNYNDFRKTYDRVDWRFREGIPPFADMRALFEYVEEKAAEIVDGVMHRGGFKPTKSSAREMIHFMDALYLLGFDRLPYAFQNELMAARLNRTLLFERILRRMHGLRTAPFDDGIRLRP